MNCLPFLVSKKWEAVHRPTGRVFRSVGTRRTRRSGPASAGSGSMRAARLRGKKSPKSEGEGAAPPPSTGETPGPEAPLPTAPGRRARAELRFFRFR